jgi:hypothetical protein
LAGHPVAQRAEIVAEVHVARRLNARQNASHNPKLLLYAGVLSYEWRMR